MCSSSSSLGRSLHPLLVPLVEECQRNDTINGTIAVTGVKSSKLDGPTERICDRFTLAVPYCGTHIKWEILFDRLHPSLPPDIICSSEDESFDPDLDNLKSLAEWDVNKPTCLFHLVEELLAEYRKYQYSILSAHQRLDFEYTTLKENNNVDIHCTPDQHQPTAKFHIPLNVDFSIFPVYLKKENPGDYYAALTVLFKTPTASKIEASVSLSPGLERIFGGKETIKLPKWNEDTYLMDYVPAVNKLLQDKVDYLIQSFVKRKEYFASLLSVLGQAVLEYDTESYKKIAFLLEFQGFSFIAHIKLSDYFPKDIPLVSISSIYHKLDEQPLQVNLNTSPYNNQLEPDENIRKTMNYIQHMLPQFREMCKSNGSFL